MVETGVKNSIESPEWMDDEFFRKILLKSEKDGSIQVSFYTPNVVHFLNNNFSDSKYPNKESRGRGSFRKRHVSCFNKLHKTRFIR